MYICQCIYKLLISYVSNPCRHRFNFPPLQEYMLSEYINNNGFDIYFFNDWIRLFQSTIVLYTKKNRSSFFVRSKHVIRIIFCLYNHFVRVIVIYDF